MKVILIAKRGLGTNIVRILRQIPEVKVDWFSGVQQTNNDFYLGNDVQMLYPVARQKSELQAVDLKAYQLAIVVDSDSDTGHQSLDGDLRSYQIAGFLAGRSIVTVGLCDSSECGQWFTDYGTSHVMRIRDLPRNLPALVHSAAEKAKESSNNKGLKGLTLWQPWAWAVANGKNIENRNWTTSYRGLVAFHASAPEFQPRGAYEVSCDALRTVLDSIGKQDLVIPGYNELPKGVFFAVGRITDCRPYIESPWYESSYSQCFQVEDLCLLPHLVPGPTKPLLFDLDSETERNIRAQLIGTKLAVAK
ncbi:MAG: hypothetical protein P4L53_09575 [Candidatus Obscuribacterales bacterium]|nr:hypothetical protein [Candidatus Obscuribacterales bacterium]